MGLHDWKVLKFPANVAKNKKKCPFYTLQVGFNEIVVKLFQISHNLT